MMTMIGPHPGSERSAKSGVIPATPTWMTTFEEHLQANCMCRYFALRVLLMGRILSLRSDCSRIADMANSLVYKGKFVGAVGHNWGMSTTPAEPTGAPGDLPGDVPVAELLEKLAEQPSNPASVAVLASVDPARLDAGAKVDYLKAWQRAQSWLDGLGQHALAAIEAGSGTEPLTPQ